jgi:transcription elongation factor Elf1
MKNAKTFPNDAKKIKITFICDACGEDTPMEAIEIPATFDAVVNATCPVCLKEFEVKIVRNNKESYVEVPDVSADDITIEVL